MSNDINIIQDATVHVFTVRYAYGLHFIAFVSKLPKLEEQLDKTKLHLELLNTLTMNAKSSDSRCANWLVSHIMANTTNLSYLCDYSHLNVLLSQPNVTFLCAPDAQETELWQYITTNK